MTLVAFRRLHPLGRKVRTGIGRSCLLTNCRLFCDALLNCHYCLHPLILQQLIPIYSSKCNCFVIRDSHILVGACMYRLDTGRPAEDAVLRRCICATLQCYDWILLTFAGQSTNTIQNPILAPLALILALYRSRQLQF